MELSDDDCIGSLLLGCVAARSHALLYVDSLQPADAPPDTPADTPADTPGKKKRHHHQRKRCDYERLVSLATDRLFAADGTSAAHGGVHVVRFDAAAHAPATAPLDDAAECVFDALCATLVPPAVESELLYADADGDDADTDSGPAQEAQHHAVVLVERAERLLFASDVFAAHLALLLARHRRGVRRPGGTWRVLRDDVRAFSLIFVVSRAAPFPGPTHLPSILVCLLSAGAHRLSHTRTHTHTHTLDCGDRWTLCCLVRGCRTHSLRPWRPSRSTPCRSRASRSCAASSPTSLRAPRSSTTSASSSSSSAATPPSALALPLRPLLPLRLPPGLPFLPSPAPLHPSARRTHTDVDRIAALVDGCMYVSPVHVQSVAAMVVRHRVVLEAGHSVESVLVDALSRTPVPV